MALAWIVHTFDDGDAYAVPLHSTEDDTVPLEVLEAD